MIDRVQALRNLRILDTAEEDAFNDIVKTASSICETPISLITLLDEERQWFKAKVGVDFPETSIEVAFCKYTVLENDGEMNIKDLSADPRFKENPFVTNEPNVRAYLGISLETKSGERVGTVCVFDDKQRNFTERQIDCLRSLSKFTMKLIEEKVTVKIVEEQNETLKLINKNLESFSFMVAHDVKAPIKTINSFSRLILNDKSINADSKLNKYLTYMHQSSENLSTIVDNLLNYSRQIQITSSEFELINIADLIKETIDMLDYNRAHLKYEIENTDVDVFSSKGVLQQSIQNIISNAIKYKDSRKQTQTLNINLKQNCTSHQLIFQDNGIGMNEERIGQVFKLFSKDDRSNLSTGVGLSVVRELLDKIGGEIQVDSKLDIGTVISLDIPTK